MYAENDTEQERGLAVVSAQAAPVIAFTQQKLDLLKRTVANGTSDDEFELFIEVAKRLQLDPFTHQIHAVMRYDAQAGRKKMTIQTGIDGYVAIADRTDMLAGIDPVIYGPTNADGYPEWAQVTVYRFRQGQRVPFTHVVYWEEYVQTNKDGKPNATWLRMPRGQLGKCATAGALRRGFPFQLSGIYVDDEMMQADSEPYIEPASQAPTHAQTRPQAQAQRPAAPAKAASASGEKPFTPLADVAFRQALNSLGIRSVEDVRAFLARHDNPTDRDGCFAAIAAEADARTVDAEQHEPNDLHDLGTVAP